MNFILLILLDISASDDDCPYLSIARRPLEALIADLVRQGEEINLLRDLVAGQNPPSPRRSQSITSETGRPYDQHICDNSELLGYPLNGDRKP
jgi:hypothetical protein